MLFPGWGGIQLVISVSWVPWESEIKSINKIIKKKKRRKRNTFFHDANRKGFGSSTQFYDTPPLPERTESSTFLFLTLAFGRVSQLLIKYRVGQM